MDSFTSISTRFDVIQFEDLSNESTWIKLGEGSFGSVYRAQYLGLPVAIKEILPRSDYDIEKYFARECKISREARHPNIVQYIGLCLAPSSAIDSSATDYLDTQREEVFLLGGKRPPKTLGNSRVLIISEYVPKGNLRSYLNLRSNSTTSPSLTWRIRISFAIDITRAMAYLHERKCLHRDLKLDNCLLTENLRVKLCDFGFARLEARNPEEIRRLSFCGTDGYMSPEILRGDPFGLSTDVYSLGVIFCELIAMKLAGTYNDFDSESAFLERLPPRYSIKSSDVKSLLEAQGVGCPRSFIDLSLRCTQVDSKLRPTIKEVLSALDAIEQSIINQERQNLMASRNDALSTLHPIPSVGSFKFAKSHDKFGGSKSSFKRIPSFQGQVVIPKATTSSLQGPLESEADLDPLKDVRNEKSKSESNLTKSCFSLDPRLITEIARRNDEQTTEDFCKSTLKIPVAIPRKHLPSSFFKPSECNLPFESSLETPLASTSSSEFLTLTTLQEDCHGPFATNNSLLSNFVLPQLGSIPTMSSKTDTFSTAKSSFKLAMEELEEAYKVPQEHIIDEGPKRGSDCFIQTEKIQASKGLTTEDQAENVESLEDRCHPPTSNNSLAQGFSRDQQTQIESPAQKLALQEVNSISKFPYTSTVSLAAISDSRSESHLLAECESNGQEQEDSGKSNLALPHRFTIVKLNWFINLLNLHQKENFSPPSTHGVCGSCQKKISARKTFLRCDDCGQKYHRKCGDSLVLSSCNR